MRIGLDEHEDDELRWLAFIAAHAALTPAEQRRLAALRVRDRRGEVRSPDDEAIASARPRARPVGGEAYQLARRLVSLVLGHSADVQAALGERRAESLADLVAALPPDTRAKAEELMDAIENARS